MIDAANKVIAIFNKFWEGDEYRAALSGAITELRAAIPLISHPESHHYQQGAIQPIDYIAANHLDFFEGNIIKYITRWRRKGTPIEDLKKAKQYIDWLIEMEER